MEDNFEKPEVTSYSEEEIAEVGAQSCCGIVGTYICGQFNPPPPK